MRFSPMPLAVAREPFNDPDWLFEPKWDGFRALAFIDGHQCRLVSRRGNAYKSWPYLCEEVAHALRCRSAVLDGEIVCLAPDGRSQFYDLVPPRVEVNVLRSELSSHADRRLACHRPQSPTPSAPVRGRELDVRTTIAHHTVRWYGRAWIFSRERTSPAC